MTAPVGGHHRRLRGGKCRQQEHAGLEAFPQHRQKRHAGERVGAGLAQRFGGFGLQLALHVAGMGVHPDDHAGDEEHGDGADHRLHAFLGGLRKRLLRPDSRPTPTAIDSATAIATPSHIGTRLFPFLRRKAAMMPTISAASSPSRRPMTKVASMPAPRKMAEGTRPIPTTIWARAVCGGAPETAPAAAAAEAPSRPDGRSHVGRKRPGRGHTPW